MFMLTYIVGDNFLSPSTQTDFFVPHQGLRVRYHSEFSLSTCVLTRWGRPPSYNHSKSRMYRDSAGLEEIDKDSVSSKYTERKGSGL